MTRTAVIVGSGVGGVRTAQALRSLGYAGDVVVVGAENEWPYDRPPLSKSFLSSRSDAAALLLTKQEAADAGIRLHLGLAAERLVPEEKRVLLGNGESLSYDVCVVATGASPRSSAWNNLPGVHLLRSIADSRALREKLANKQEIAIIGGGFIGAEVAASARTLGLRVTVIDPLPLPMEKTLGTKVAQLVADLHENNGVTTRFGVGVNSIESVGQELQLNLSDGNAVMVDTVVLGIGASPSDGWLSCSGLPVNDGLICDRYCQVEGRCDIFAVGDVSRWFSTRYQRHVRAEHWTNAVEQARCVAHNIVFPDQMTPFEAVDYIWTDQYDWKIQVAGQPVNATAATEAAVGDFDGSRPRGAVLYGDGTGTLCGAVTVNWPRAIAQCRQALSAHTPYAEALAQVADRGRRVRG